MTQVGDSREITLPESTGAGKGSDRRAQGERRRYNRRSADSPVSPPYYEAFDRIASALERIERLVAARLGEEPPEAAGGDPPDPAPDR